jgi:hypothetical protein
MGRDAASEGGGGSAGSACGGAEAGGGSGTTAAGLNGSGVGADLRASPTPFGVGFGRAGPPSLVLIEAVRDLLRRSM